MREVATVRPKSAVCVWYMERKEIELVLAVLGQKPTVFHYFKDRYALMLLAYAVSSGAQPLRLLKASAFSGLLRKEVLRDVLDALPDGNLDVSALVGLWPKAPLAYVLTLGSWPKQITKRRHPRYYSAYNQTSRKGYNVVLQLNFPFEHERAYRTLIPADRRCPFECATHPIADGRRTLAWSRIDFDLETGEALIEEVQSDWIRLAYSLQTTVERLETRSDGTLRLARQVLQARGLEEGRTALARYLKHTLAIHREIWAEAMLASSIQFIVESLGLRRIYFHTYETGARLKSITWRRPPRSLYSQLPKRFCFEKTNEPPEFLKRSCSGHSRRILENETNWFVLDFRSGGQDVRGS